MASSTAADAAASAVAAGANPRSLLQLPVVSAVYSMLGQSPDAAAAAGTDETEVSVWTLVPAWPCYAPLLS